MTTSSVEGMVYTSEITIGGHFFKRDSHQSIPTDLLVF